MTVSILVPWRGGDPDREAAWAWVRARWAAQHADWQVVEGRCPDGPWRKGVAVAHALAGSTGDIVVVADADVWCDGVDLAVATVEAGTGWAVPHHHVHRLDQQATAAVLAGGDLHGTTVRRPYRGFLGGGIVVLHRERLAEVPFDTRFAGWGSEDEAFALAATCLFGQPWRGVADLWHLWHEPAPRLNQRVGSAESLALYRRYTTARTPKAMRALLAEAR